jgi:hypothetical protein
MPLWGRNDQSVTANSTTTKETTTGAPIGTWALVKGDQVNRVDGANAHFGNTSSGSRASVDVAMFGNTTSNSFLYNVAVGVFGYDAAETSAERADGGERPAHAGWILRTEGTGGRAGRVQMETLVAMGSLGAQTAAFGTAASVADASDDAIAADFTLRIATNPVNRTANSTNNDIATFTVAGASTPTGATLGYFWQSWNGSAFANLSNAGAYSNTTTATLSVLANTASNAEIYRAGVTATGAATVYSTNAVITITT